MENVADFGLTQLPVLEKRVQIVDMYRDEVRAVVPADHPLANMELRSRAKTSFPTRCCSLRPG